MKEIKVIILADNEINMNLTEYFLNSYRSEFIAVNVVDTSSSVGDLTLMIEKHEPDLIIVDYSFENGSISSLSIIDEHLDFRKVANFVICTRLFETEAYEAIESLKENYPLAFIENMKYPFQAGYIWELVERMLLVPKSIVWDFADFTLIEGDE